MEQVQPLSKEKSRGYVPAINRLNSLERAPRKKPETLKRNFNDTLATCAYYCKYHKSKFDTLWYQEAHRLEHAAKRLAQAMDRTANAFPQVNPCFNPYYFGTQAILVPGRPVAFGPRTWPASADVFGPIYGGTPKKPTTIPNPRAPAWRRPAMANRLKGMVYQLVNYNGGPHFPTTVSPRSAGPKPPPANVLANGSSLSTQGLGNEGLDLSLRL